MIVFKKVRYKNFISTGNYYTEIDFQRSSNTLIIGSNGAGKSTMLDALCFTLFGKAFRSINKPQLINAINQKDCVTECEFDIGNKKYKIIRGIKPNIFEIYQDGDLLNQDAASRDYQEYLEKFILKLNYKSFTQIVILGSASFVPFMQLSASDRRSIIEDLLDIQIFSTMNTVLKEKMSGNKDHVVENNSKLQIVEAKIEIQNTHIKSIQKTNDEKVEEYDNQIKLYNTDIFELQEKIQQTSNAINVLQTDVENKIEVENRLKKFTKLESQIENNLSKYRADISFFEQNDNCPTCKQEIALGFKEQQIKENNDRVTEIESGLKVLEEKLLAEQERLNEITVKQKEIQKLQISNATNTTSITETNKYIAKLKSQIESLKSNKDNLDAENTKLNELNNELEIILQKKKELIDEKTYYEAASGLLKDTGIKTKIIKQYLPVINKVVNKHLATFDFFVNFNLDESFKETIKSRHRDAFSYESFSEGEKQRIDMALMLTWRTIAKLKNSANTNLLILDEIFDSSLDANGTEYLMNILHMLEDVNLFVISHKGDILQDKFRSVIKFEKVNNFSRIAK
jgi:DNA repair exonuclease SbcCD ATPase subunit